MLWSQNLSTDIWAAYRAKHKSCKMSQFAESHVEDAALEWLSGLSYAVLHGPDISPDGPTSERVSYDQDSC